MVTEHAEQQTAKRVADIVDVIAPRIAVAVRMSARTGKSYAALVAIEKASRGDLSADINGRESNGELVIAIVRDGRHITTFSRRRGQVLTAKFFRVDACLNLTK